MHDHDLVAHDHVFVAAIARHGAHDLRGEVIDRQPARNRGAHRHGEVHIRDPPRGPSVDHFAHACALGGRKRYPRAVAVTPIVGPITPALTAVFAPFVTRLVAISAATLARLIAILIATLARLVAIFIAALTRLIAGAILLFPLAGLVPILTALARLLALILALIAFARLIAVPALLLLVVASFFALLPPAFAGLAALLTLALRSVPA
jgi:hypothetical protein